MFGAHATQQTMYECCCFGPKDYRAKINATQQSLYECCCFGPKRYRAKITQRPAIFFSLRAVHHNSRASLRSTRRCLVLCKRRETVRALPTAVLISSESNDRDGQHTFHLRCS